jgi:hypothetical protein
MFNNMKIQKHIERPYDAKIEKWPARPMLDKHIKLAFESCMKWFPSYYASRCSYHNVLESHEANEYEHNKNFLSGEAVIFLIRESKRFDLSIVACLKDDPNPDSETVVKLFCSHLKIHTNLMCRKTKSRYMNKLMSQMPDLAPNESILYVEHDLVDVIQKLETPQKLLDIKEEFTAINVNLYEFFIKKTILGYPNTWLKVEFEDFETLTKDIKEYVHGIR